MGALSWVQLQIAKLRTARQLRSEVGQGTLEYVLILVMIVIFVIGILIFFRDDLQAFIEQMQEWLQSWFADVTEGVEGA